MEPLEPFTLFWWLLQPLILIIVYGVGKQLYKDYRRIMLRIRANKGENTPK